MESIFPTIVVLFTNVDRAVTPRKNPSKSRVLQIAKPGATPNPLRDLANDDSNTGSSVSTTVDGGSATDSEEQEVEVFSPVAPSTGEVPAQSGTRTEGGIAPAVIESTLPGNSPSLIRTLDPISRGGGLPLPIARVSPESNGQVARPPWSTNPEEFRDLAGGPGSSFGKNRFDETFKSVREGARKDPLVDPLADAAKEKKSEEEKKKEEKERLEKLKEGVKNFTEGVTPFDREDYDAYEAARDLFFKDEKDGKTVGKLADENEDFVNKAIDLFFTDNNGRKDNDPLGTNGKVRFEEFVLDRIRPSQIFTGPSNKKKDQPHNPDRENDPDHKHNH